MKRAMERLERGGGGEKERVGKRGKQGSEDGLEVVGQGGKKWEGCL